MRRILLPLLLLLTIAAFPPTVSAHTCGGTAADCSCPIPNDGQYHSHGGTSGGCTGGPGGSATGGPGGGSVTPGPGLALVVAGLGVMALLIRKG